MAQYKNLDIIIDSSGNFRELDTVNSDRKPFEYEYCELRRAVGTSSTYTPLEDLVPISENQLLIT